MITTLGRPPSLNPPSATDCPINHSGAAFKQLAPHAENARIRDAGVDPNSQAVVLLDHAQQTFRIRDHFINCTCWGIKCLLVK
jgi:hypothetical protein